MQGYKEIIEKDNLKPYPFSSTPIFQAPNGKLYELLGAPHSPRKVEVEIVQTWDDMGNMRYVVVAPQPIIKLFK